VATGVYMAPQSTDPVNMLSDNSSAPVSQYFHSDFFSPAGNTAQHGNDAAQYGYDGSYHG